MLENPVPAKRGSMYIVVWAREVHITPAISVWSQISLSGISCMMLGMESLSGILRNYKLGGMRPTEERYDL